MEVYEKTPRGNKESSLESNQFHDDQRKSAEINGSSLPVNTGNGAISWEESRRNWIGGQPKRLKRTSKDPAVSWCATYEDLLTGDPFDEPIPLSNVVNLLVDTWEGDGLYDFFVDKWDD